MTERAWVAARARIWVAMLVALAIMASCSDGSASDGSDADRAASDEQDAPDGSPGGDGPCAWAVRADKETLNIAYPDTAATYWSVRYELAPGEQLELAGEFPSARYVSFITYGSGGGAVDVLADRDIVPDAGSSNPFAGGGASAPSGDERHYTVTILGEEPGALGDNALGTRVPAADSSATSSTSTSLQGVPADDPVVVNVLGSGGDEAVRGSALYRVYVPGDDGDPTGGAGLPEVTVVGADGTRQAVPTCREPGASEAALALVEANGPATDRPAPSQPVFIRPQAGAANLFPNPDNVYLATIVQHEPGRIVVVRGRGPTFPDAAADRPVGSGEQVRYWSFCTNEYRKPYPVTECRIDAETALDEEGFFTYVVSTPEDRPANATGDNGVTWLDWGSTEVNGLLLFRHMLADPSFAESAINLPPGTLASPAMGDYAPKGVYCTKDAFEREEASCLPA